MSQTRLSVRNIFQKLCKIRYNRKARLTEKDVKIRKRFDLGFGSSSVRKKESNKIKNNKPDDRIQKQSVSPLTNQLQKSSWRSQKDKHVVDSLKMINPHRIFKNKELKK